MKKLNEERKRTTNIFTDREEPRKTFWNNFKQLKKSMQTAENDIRVICYYGIRGIGKTSLLKKIRTEMKDKLKAPVVITHDFSEETDSRSVLYQLRNQLNVKYKFEFPLFDYGYYCFARKIGEDKNKPEIKGFIERSNFLSSLLEVIGYIPEFDILPTLVKIADKAITYKFNYIQNTLQNYQDKIEMVEDMEPKELIPYLTNLFTADLKNNIKNFKDPLVIMFDTYEALVDEMRNDESLNKDEWIRGEDGLIQNTPNVLWVIAGREKLKWECFDHDWKKALETHLLGDLSKADSIDILITAGIKNIDLCNQLYELTHGTPIYLYLCIRQYEQIISKGKEAAIDDFGKDNLSLVLKFTSGMDSSVRDIVYFLSCLKIWTNEMLSGIKNNVLPGFSPTAYDKVKQFSFITVTDNVGNVDGITYNIHKTIGDILYQHCPTELKEKASKNAIEFCQDKLKYLSITSPSYTFYVQLLTNYALDFYEEEEVIYNFFMRNVYYHLKKLNEIGQISEVYSVLTPLQKKATDLDSKLLTAIVLKCKSHALSINGNISEATECSNNALQNIFHYCKNEHRKSAELIISYKLDYAQRLLAEGKFQETYDLSTYVLELDKTNLSEENELITDFMSISANALVGLGDYDNARIQLEKILKQQINKYGNETYNVVYAKQNLAIVLEQLGNYREAQILYEESLNTLKSLENYGDNHPYTLNITINLASTYRNLGKLEVAKKLIEDILTKEKYIGKKHIIIINALINKIALLLMLEKCDEASSLIEECLPIVKERLGKKHPDTLKIKESFAITLLTAKEYTEAIELLKGILIEKEEQLPNNHPSIIETINLIAFTYHNTGEIEKGKPYVQRLKRIIEKGGINNKLNYIKFKHTIAWYYIDTECYDQAETLTKELVAEIESFYPEQKLWLHNIYLVAAICLEKQNKINASYMDYSEKLYSLIENKNDDFAREFRVKLDELKHSFRNKRE